MSPASLEDAASTQPPSARDERPRGRVATVVHVLTVPLSLVFLRGQVGYVKRRGFAVHAITSPGPELAEFGRAEDVPVHAVRMPRSITPLGDLVAVAKLVAHLRRIHPDVVHAATPKGGLLGMIAATLAGTGARIYHIRGLPFVTATGLRRRLLRTTERVSCRLAHRVLAVSHSMRRIAIDEGLCPPDKIAVLCGGSGNGVDAMERFRPRGAEVRTAERARLGIPDDALVIGFVGRLVRDKGVVELASAWQQLRERHPALHLVLAGRVEQQDALPPGVLESLRRDRRVHLPGVVRDMPALYAACDIAALPTYREGFPNVALEAAAMALPIVATSVAGCVDAVEHGRTGTLVPPRDAGALCTALSRYVEDPELRRAHGAAARERVLEVFRQEAIWEAVADEYERLLSRPRETLYAAYGKRALDLALTSAALAVLAPAGAAIAAAIKLESPGPVFYRQERVGRDGRSFMIWKFRSMVVAAEHLGAGIHVERKDPRITRVGRVLRRLSLDELPQLLNVLAGDMSLVGPRPTLRYQVELYDEHQRQRLRVRPGITGWAQVHGRKSLDWGKRIELDVEYAKSVSLWRDLVIMLRTIPALFEGEGAADSDYWKKKVSAGGAPGQGPPAPPSRS